MMQATGIVMRGFTNREPLARVELTVTLSLAMPFAAG